MTQFFKLFSKSFSKLTTSSIAAGLIILISPIRVVPVRAIETVELTKPAAVDSTTFSNSASDSNSASNPSSNPVSNSVGAGSVEADLDLTIFPPVAYLTAKPGETTTHRVIVQYQGETIVSLLPQLWAFTPDQLTAAPVLHQLSQLNYISLQNPDKKLGQPFLLQPGQSVELVLKISPPLTAQQAEYPLSLLLTATPTGQFVITGAGGQAAGAIASNLILSVQDDLENQGKLRLDQIKTPKLIDSFGRLKFTIQVDNVGRNALAAQGEIKITNLADRTVASWFIYPDVVLAGYQRNLRATHQNPTDLDSQIAPELTELKYTTPFLFGPYTIDITLNSTNSQTEITEELTTTVVAFPFSLLAVGLIGVIIYRGYRAWERQHTKKWS